ncbi:MAG: CRTAC1 family protein [Acidobacteria bacterium]|nr:CRTAC1 family protein [Acidobacteriota bacterium]
MKRRTVNRLSRRSLTKNLLGGLVLMSPAANRLSVFFDDRGPSKNPGPATQPKDVRAVANFVDIAARAGLTAKTIIGGVNRKEYILETTGGGVALFDYDNDGWLDIFLVNGSRLEGFKPGEEPTNHLYRNNRDGTFTDVTQKAGLVHHGWGQGVCVADVDGDGNLDLFVTYYGQNVLYHNNGDGTFTDVTRQSGLLTANGEYSTGAAFLDYDRDGRPDLFVVHYAEYEDATRYKYGQGPCVWHGLPVMCGPRGLRGTKNTLYRNNRDGTFSDVSERAGILKVGARYGFTPLVLDYDNDGWPDIYVANDSCASSLFHNNRDGTFTEEGILAGAAFNSDGREQAGMGLSAGDYDNDGWLDIIKTNFSDDRSTFYRNQRDRTFDDVTLAAGLGANIRYLGWGVKFLDIDNDGWSDIFIVNGHVYPEVDTAPLESTYEERKIAYLNKRDGTFEDVSTRSGPGVLMKKCSRGAAFGDLFNCGQIDIVINNMNDTPTLLRNLAPTANHALLLQLVGAQSNPSPLGARVTVQVENRRMMDEVRSGGSFCSQNDLRLHFGLGSNKQADQIEIQWPSGKREVLRNVAGDRLVVIREGSGLVDSQKFRPPPKLD